MAIPGNTDWNFGGIIRCGSDKEGVRFAQKIIIDPNQYEPVRTSFSIQMNNLIRLSPGASDSDYLEIPNKSPEQVLFKIDNLPSGVEAQLSYPARNVKTAQASLAIHAAPNLAPGTYVIPLSARSGDETARTELLIDVVRN
jgi:hypothetical protein